MLKIMRISAAVLACTAMAAAISTAYAAELEEIVVTATKRTEAIQSIGAAVTSISADDLQSRGLDQASTLQFQVPNLIYSQTQGADFITIRGVGMADASGGAEAGVASNIDGVFLPRRDMTNIVVGDLQRIEVLRGPQGTLYGRNATGGVINYISAKPTQDFQSGVTVGGGNYDEKHGEGYVSGPISGDKVLGRLFVQYSDFSGYDQNLNPALFRRFGGDEKYAARGSLRLMPTDELTIDLQGSYLHRNGTQDFIASLQTFTPDLPPGPAFLGFSSAGLAAAGYPGITNASQLISTAPHTLFQDFAPHEDQQVLATIGTVDWNKGDIGAVSDLDVKLILSYLDNHDNSIVDGDSTGIRGAIVQRSDPSLSHSAEFDVTGAVAKKLYFVTGAYYLHEAGTSIANYVLVSPLTALSLFEPTGFHNQYQKEENNTYGVFTDLTYSVTDRFRVVGGVRYSKDTKDIHKIQDSGRPGTPNDCDEPDDSVNTSSVTPKAALQFDAADQVMLYAQYSKGVKPAGSNYANCGPGAVFAPEKLSAYEAGLKSTIFGGAATLNLTGFYYDYKDYQLFSFNGFSTLISNAPKAHSQGVELEFNARPVDDLRLNFAATWLDAKFDELTGTDEFGAINAICNTVLPFGPCVTPPAGSGSPLPQNLAGKRLVRAPDASVMGGVEYNFHLPPNGLFGTVTARVEGYWVGKQYFTQFNSPWDAQNAYSIGNAFLTLHSADEHYLVRAFVKNFGNANYVVQKIEAPLPWASEMAGQWGPPRTWGMELSARF